MFSFLAIIKKNIVIWHEFVRLRQQPHFHFSKSLVEENKGRTGGGGLTQESGVFLELEFKGTPRSLHKPPSIGTKRKLNLQGTALYTFYRGTFSH